MKNPTNNIQAPWVGLSDDEWEERNRFSHDDDGEDDDLAYEIWRDTHETDED